MMHLHPRIIGHILLRMVRRRIRLARLTLVCEVSRYRLVQVRQDLKKELILTVLWPAVKLHWGRHLSEGCIKQRFQTVVPLVSLLKQQLISEGELGFLDFIAAPDFRLCHFENVSLLRPHGHLTQRGLVRREFFCCSRVEMSASWRISKTRALNCVMMPIRQGFVAF